MHFVNKIKVMAKKVPLFSWANATIKCLQLKRELSALRKYYERRADDKGFVYSAVAAEEEFRHRLYIRRPDFTPRESGQLRVFWVGACQSQDESGFIQSLRRLCVVTEFHNIDGNYGLWYGGTNSESSSLTEVRAANDRALLQQVKQAVENGGLDLLIGQLWAHVISKEALAKVQVLGVLVINISMDDRLPLHWGYHDDIRMGSIGLAPSLDMVLTTSPETCLWYGVESCPSIFWPLASDPTVFTPSENIVRDINVLFIGNKYGIRGTIIRYLEGRGLKIDCYGAGWPNGYVNAEQMAALSKRARIILGVGTVGHCRDVYTLKLRDFDALMTGALYLTHRNPDLCRLFKEGLEIECYEKLEEAYLKIRFYLDNPDDLQRVAMAGQIKAFSKYTWDHRIDKTFSRLGLLCSSQPAISSTDT